MAAAAAAAASGTDTLESHKAALLKSFVDGNSLTFGNYTLKSGRQSPYFFNAGSLHTGRLLGTLSDAFAATIQASFGAAAAAATAAAGPDPGFDVVFGPAYKGIPLACTAVESLARRDPQRYGGVSYCFDRKSVKTYGDGGRTVGAPLAGKRVLVVDDVITAGTAVRASLNLIGELGGSVVGIVVALDRQERAPSAAELGLEAGAGGGAEAEGVSSIGLLRRELGVPVIAVLTLDDIIEGYKAIGTAEEVQRLLEYRERYKATA